ncbi:hypothetical protein SH139x_004266 [Planctomycetaceae bacterium SH139]
MDDCRQTKFRTEELDPGTVTISPPEDELDRKEPKFFGLGCIVLLRMLFSARNSRELQPGLIVPIAIDRINYFCRSLLGLRDDWNGQARSEEMVTESGVRAPSVLKII